MRPRLLVEPEAEAELDEAFTWYEGRAAGLGSEFLRAVRASFALIRRNPEQCPRVRGDIRRALVRRFPYAVYQK
jgi:plasmid stabilization system protein ParE